MSKETTNSNYSSETEESKKYTNEELVEVKPIKDTPFVAVKVGEGWFLALGKYRLSGIKETEEDVIEDSKNTTWDRLIQVFLIVKSLDLDNVTGTINGLKP